jgi:hypothetical protein
VRFGLGKDGLSKDGLGEFGLSKFCALLVSLGGHHCCGCALGVEKMGEQQESSGGEDAAGGCGHRRET